MHLIYYIKIIDKDKAFKFYHTTFVFLIYASNVCNVILLHIFL